MCVRARLGPQVGVLVDADVKVDVGLGGPLDGAVGAQGPARGPLVRSHGGLHLEHVAHGRVLLEALAAAQQHVAGCAAQGAVQSLGRVLGAGAGSVSEEPLALLGVDDLELERLGVGGDGGSVDAGTIVSRGENNSE